MDIQFIHPSALRTSLQVIMIERRIQSHCWIVFCRPAALSTHNPERNRQGGWLTPRGREIKAMFHAQADARRAAMRG